jgi:hypothetical protein
MALDLETFPENEVIALTFAQHYAESCCHPDPAAWERLATYYGAETANDILAYLRMITFGNLFGNTFDALLSRITGKPAPGSSLWSELGVLLGAICGCPLPGCSSDCSIGKAPRRLQVKPSNKIQNKEIDS